MSVRFWPGAPIEKKCGVNKSSRRSMDRISPSEGGDAGSTPAESTTYRFLAYTERTSMYSDKLKENLFVGVDYPKSITDFIGVAEPWREFCKLPLETKKKFEFMDHQEDADPGYRFRSKKEGREDKEYFHAYPHISELIEKDGNTDLVKHTPALESFFTYAANVQRVAHDFALAIGSEMGKDIPELQKLIDDKQIRSVLRFLHYTNDIETEVIASQHFDRSLYTLHLYESGPGLQFLNWDMQWTDAPIDIGKTVIFSGYRMEQLTRGKLQKTWHRVARKEAVRDRLSVVLFVWTNAVSSYDREARSQDMTPSYVRI